MAGGSISLSLSQQFDRFGNVLSGGELQFYQAGTVATPQNAFQDSALTIPHPNPIILNAAGRVPQFYLADGFIKIVLSDVDGQVQVTADNILVVGASSGGGGGGGGGTVDPTTVYATGDVKMAYGTAILAGFVRANGRTIGSSTSGATERALADTQGLYVYLWQVDPSLAVSSGRGASAVADFAANKTITLPDFRGRVLAGFDDMGNSAAGRLTGTTMSGTGIGAVGGSQTQSLITSNLPPYSPAGSLSLSTSVSTSVSTSITDPGHAHNVQVPQQGSTIGSPISSKFFQGQNTTGATVLNVTSDSAATGISASSSASSTATPTGTFSGAAQGGSSAAFAVLQPTIFVTTYLKL